MNKQYNLAYRERLIIEECISNNPNKSMNQIAGLLGISERSLYRKIKEYKVNREGSKKLKKAITKLESLGYRGFAA